jgi:hypothetical protein
MDTYFKDKVTDFLKLSVEDGVLLAGPDKKTFRIELFSQFSEWFIYWYGYRREVKRRDIEDIFKSILNVDGHYVIGYTTNPDFSGVRNKPPDVQ